VPAEYDTSEYSYESASYLDNSIKESLSNKENTREKNKNVMSKEHNGEISKRHDKVKSKLSSQELRNLTLQVKGT
jgi:hypothetical protein